MFRRNVDVLDNDVSLHMKMAYPDVDMPFNLSWTLIYHNLLCGVLFIDTTHPGRDLIDLFQRIKRHPIDRAAVRKIDLPVYAVIA